MTDQTDPLTALRTPFPPEEIGKLPKPTTRDGKKGHCNECGGYHQLPAVHLDFVGHAAVTKRLLDVDPQWSWEPLVFGPDGLPFLDRNGGLWIKLTIAGVTRYGYGDAQGKSGGNAIKEVIGDAIRNGAMRFGVALDLWHKGSFAEEADDTPQVDWLLEAQNAVSAETTLAVWNMARANKAPLDVLDQIVKLGAKRRDEEKAAAKAATEAQAAWDLKIPAEATR